MEQIPEDRLDLFEKPAVAIFCSLLPDGHPHASPVWVDYDGDHLLVVTRTETRKYRNVVADPRVTVTVTDPDNPYRYVEVRGEVTSMPEEGALAFSDRMARKYWDVDEYPFSRDVDRVLLHIRPDRVIAPDVPTPHSA